MQLFKQFRYPSNRQALMAAVSSGVLLFTLVVLWLAVSTHTALMSRQLDIYDRQSQSVTDETNALWKQIGDITSPQEMERRMKAAGYSAPDGVQFLLPQPTSTAIMTTSIAGGGSR